MTLVRTSTLGGPYEDRWFPLCSAADCTEGESNVKACRAFFENLVASKLLPRESFEAAVAGLEADLAAALDAAGWFRGFDSDCCVAAEAGLRARKLQGTMADEANRLNPKGPRVYAPAPPRDPPKKNPITSTIDSAILGAVALGALWIFLNSSGRRPRRAA